MKEKQVWTIGHSTRSLDELLGMLNAFEIECLIDVRSYPSSKRFPHFNKESLKIDLSKAGIKYLHLKDLGGRRKTSKDSKNTAWRLSAFRGYADYMESDQFRKAAEELQKIAEEQRTAYMCAEAVWWSCHRSLISDYLKFKGWKVMHIMAMEKATEHPYTAPARIVDNELSYEGLL